MGAMDLHTAQVLCGAHSTVLFSTPKYLPKNKYRLNIVIYVSKHLIGILVDFLSRHVFNQQIQKLP